MFDFFKEGIFLNENQIKKAQNIWQAVLGKIEMKIPKASFDMAQRHFRNFL